jgi:pimeloyl-ACP methyl ester carboxylesterase
VLPDEYTAVGELAGDGFSVAVARIHETHEGIAERVFGSIGTVSAPVRLTHDAIAALAYGATATIGGSLLRLAGRAASMAAGPDATSIERTAAGRVALGALSGAFGDTLARRGNALAVPMAARPRGAAAPRIALFLHGLCETDDAWFLGADRSRPYGPRLRDELGYTPVYVRYNSGLHISDNGRRLSALIDELVREWPVEVSEIALIGHSMGGLVARSACHYGAGSEWTSKVRQIVSLGAPYHGAPLERAAHAAAHALGRLPETRALANALNARSVGIKDLHQGYLTDECWEGQDPQAFLRHAAREIAFLPTAHHYFVSATLTRAHDHPFGRHVGDLLVLHTSAWGSQPQGERMRFPVDQYRHVGGATHFDLLNHPAVGDQLIRWLTPRLIEASATC